MSGLLKMTLADPGIPAAIKDPANWSEAMRKEGPTISVQQLQRVTGIHSSLNSERSARPLTISIRMS